MKMNVTSFCSFSITTHTLQIKVLYLLLVLKINLKSTQEKKQQQIRAHDINSKRC